MATISIRVSDDLKAKLEGLAHESGGTISGVVTEALGSMVGSPRTDYPEEMAPLTIAPVNRLILREYPEAFAVLRPEIPNSRCEELYDILDMFRVLRASYEDLPEDEKAEVDERDISPQGFDYNDMEEGRLAGYVKHLFADKRYEELAEPLRKYSDGGNSHGPRLEMYRRMLHCFKPLWRKHMLGDRFLGLAEIEKVIAAQRYDSGY